MAINTSAPPPPHLTEKQIKEAKKAHARGQKRVFDGIDGLGSLNEPMRSVAEKAYLCAGNLMAIHAMTGRGVRVEKDKMDILRTKLSDAAAEGRRLADALDPDLEELYTVGGPTFLGTSARSFHHAVFDLAAGAVILSGQEQKPSRIGLSIDEYGPLLTQLRREWREWMVKAKLRSNPLSHFRGGHQTERDAFIHQQLSKGQSLKSIRDRVNEHDNWDPLTTLQGVSQAARRYEKRLRDGGA
jgi:hypothetical protein